MTIQTAVLIENLMDFRIDLRWFSYSILSTQYHTVAVITHDKYDAMFTGRVRVSRSILNDLI